MKPFVSLQTHMRFSQTFLRVLEYHLPEGAEIIDPTPGEKHSWKYYLREIQRCGFFPPKKFTIHFIRDDISSFGETLKHVKKNGPADAVFFDPPYIFGHTQSEDVRREDYGGYNYSFHGIQDLIRKANEILPTCLKKDGLLFLKYTDVFSLAERRFFLCAHLWTETLSNFRPIDHYIIQHHHVSPTAWQVKDRPCGIVNYTYLTVYNKAEEDELR